MKTPFIHQLNRMLCGLLALALAVTSINAAAGETVRYIHTDHLGTPIAVTDENGNVVERYEYEPYGLQTSGPVEDGPGYTGHVEDAATGLTYMQQRYYDPQIGMFLSVDPVTAYGNPVGQFNRYRYANGNPYKYTDPDGRCAAVVVCAGISLGVLTIMAFIKGVQGTQKALENADVMNNEEAGESTAGDVVIDEKISDQLSDRGWTEEEVQETTKTEPVGTSTDNTRGRNDSASVYGSKDKGHIVVNDDTKEVVQVSDKTDPDWVPDARIEWNEE